MDKFTFLDLAEKVIREEGRPLTVREIWGIATQKSLTTRLQSQGATPIQTLSAVLYREVKENPEASRFTPNGSYPVRYKLKDMPTITIEELATLDDVAADKDMETEEKESELHKHLVYFAFNEWGMHCKTIRDGTTSKAKAKRGQYQWLHPDIVGCIYPDWNVPQVFELRNAIGECDVKIFSFELKRRLITYPELRQYFFQAVSNSRWAHAGYLVAATIDEDRQFLSELRRLSATFGIGVIKLEPDNPDDTRILYPAQERDSIDWDTVKLLAAKNGDFHEFLDRIAKDLKIHETRPEDYDRVIAIELLASK